jgi:alcohol dehydrogenase (cytochrome c)
MRRRYPIMLGIAAFLPAVIVRAGLPGASFSAEQATQGVDTYAARCAVCHGAELQGGDHAPALRGSGFLANWQGQPARKLYSRIISTMPLDDAGSLSESETLALTAMIARRNGASDGPAHATASDLNMVALSFPNGDAP